MNEIEVVDSPEFEKLKQEAIALQAEADAFQVVDDESRKIASDQAKLIGIRTEQVDALTHKPWRSALTAYEEIQKWRKGLIDHFSNPRKTYASKIGNYDLGILQKRQKELKAAQDKADKEAREKREAEIQAARERKDKEAVTALKQAPIPVAQVQTKTAEPAKVEGVSTRFKWVLDRIINQDAIPRRHMIPNEKSINGAIADLGERHGIPGITIKQVPITSFRTK